MNAQNEIYSIMTVENFVLGFRLGMRLALGALEENDGELTAVEDGRR